MPHDWLHSQQCFEWLQDHISQADIIISNYTTIAKNKNNVRINATNNNYNYTNNTNNKKYYSTYNNTNSYTYFNNSNIYVNNIYSTY